MKTIARLAALAAGLLALLALAAECRASYVLWAGLDASSVVRGPGGVGRLVSDFDVDSEINTMRMRRNDSLGRALYLSIYVEDPPGEAVDGEFGMDTWTCRWDTGERFALTDWAAFALGDDAPDRRSDEIVFELGFYDWTMGTDDDPSSWDTFHPVASASATVGDLMDGGHTYPAFTLNPPVEEPWRPAVFFAEGSGPTDVPEPSSAAMLALGALALIGLGRRRP